MCFVLLSLDMNLMSEHLQCYLLATLVLMCFVIGFGYLDCSTATLDIVILELQEGFNAAIRAGFYVSKVDIEQKYEPIKL